MKCEQEIWLAKDVTTGDWNAFEEEPTLHGVLQFWASKSGYITPMRMYAADIMKFCTDYGISTEKPFKARITLEISR